MLIFRPWSIGLVKPDEAVSADEGSDSALRRKRSPCSARVVNVAVSWHLVLSSVRMPAGGALGFEERGTRGEVPGYDVEAVNDCSRSPRRVGRISGDSAGHSLAPAPVPAVR